MTCVVSFMPHGDREKLKKNAIHTAVAWWCLLGAVPEEECTVDYSQLHVIINLVVGY